MRAVEANHGILSSAGPILEGRGKVEGDGGVVLLAHATRGRRRPSLDVRKEDNPTIFRLESLDTVRGEKQRRGRREGVSAVVHAIWVGGLHFGGHVGGWTIDISDGRVTVALATLGSYRGRVRDNCGDFLDQEICGQTDQSARPP